MSKYDIIIIGSGLGGLECGAILFLMEILSNRSLMSLIN